MSRKKTARSRREEALERLMEDDPIEKLPEQRQTLAYHIKNKTKKVIECLKDSDIDVLLNGS